MMLARQPPTRSSHRAPLVAAAWLAVCLVRPEFVLAVTPPAAQADTIAKPDPAVQAGRDALSAPPDRFPWYDPNGDTIRRIQLDPAADGNPRSGNDNSGDSSGTGSDHRPGQRGGRFGKGGDDGDGSDAPGGSRDDRRDSSSNSQFDPSAASATWLIWLAWIALAVLLAVIAYYLIKAFLNREARGAKESTSDESDDPDSAPLESLPAKVNLAKGDLLDECRRLYEVGNYNTAIIYLFAYQLIKLDQNQWIRLAKGKTNRDYLRELENRRSAAADFVESAEQNPPRRTPAGGSRIGPELAGILARTMIPFEDVFFGDHTLDRAGFEACWLQVEQFQRLAQQAAA